MALLLLFPQQPLRAEVTWVALRLPVGAIVASATLSAIGSLTTTVAVGAASSNSASASATTTQGVGTSSTLSATGSGSTGNGVGGSESASASATITAADGVANSTTLSSVGAITTAQSVAVGSLLVATGAIVTAQGVAAGSLLSATAFESTGNGVGVAGSASATTILTTAQGVAASSGLVATAAASTAQGVGANELVLSSVSETGAIAIGGPAALGAIASLVTTQSVAASLSVSATATVTTTQGVSANSTLSATGSETTGNGVGASGSSSAAASLLVADAIGASASLSATTASVTTQGVANATTSNAITNLTTTQTIAVQNTLSSNSDIVTTQGIATNSTLITTSLETTSNGVGTSGNTSAIASLLASIGVVSLLTASVDIVTTQDVSCSVTIDAQASLNTNVAIECIESNSSNANITTTVAIAVAEAALTSVTEVTASVFGGPAALGAIADLATSQGISITSGTAQIPTSVPSGEIGTISRTLSSTGNITANASTIDIPPVSESRPSSSSPLNSGASSSGWTRQSGRYLERFPLPARANALGHISELVGDAHATISQPHTIIARASTELPAPFEQGTAHVTAAPVFASGQGEVTFVTESSTAYVPLSGSGELAVEIDPDISSAVTAQISRPSGLVSVADTTYDLEALAFGVVRSAASIQAISNSGLPELITSAVISTDKVTEYVSAYGLNYINQPISSSLAKTEIPSVKANIDTFIDSIVITDSQSSIDSAEVVTGYNNSSISEYQSTGSITFNVRSITATNDTVIPELDTAFQVTTETVRESVSALSYTLLELPLSQAIGTCGSAAIIATARHILPTTNGHATAQTTARIQRTSTLLRDTVPLSLANTADMNDEREALWLLGLSGIDELDNVLT